MMSMNRMMVVLGAAWAVLLCAAAHGQVAVRAKVMPERGYVGDAFQLTIEVAGSKGPERPRIPDVPGVDFAYSGGQDTSRRSVMIINGRRTEDNFEGYVFSYRVTPSEAGVVTIPAIPVVVDGKEYRTEPVRFLAVEPGEVQGFKLTLEAAKREVYVGEPVLVRLTWYLAENASGGTFSMSEHDDQFELFAPAMAPGARAGGSEFVLFGKPAVAVQGRGELDGMECQTISVERVFVARRAGRVTLGPVRLAFDVPVGRGFFGRERRVVTSNAIEFDVRELPTPTPPNFSGLVGVYRFEARAEPRDVHVGDPITLLMYVLGPEPLEAVPAMLLSGQPGLAGKFRTPSEPAIPVVQQTDLPNGERAAVFTQTIRAESERVTEIPALELPYFDVEKGEYGVARTRPIPLNVSPTSEVAIPEVAGKGAEAPVEPDKVDGLVAVVRAPALVASERFDLMRAVRSPVAIGLLGGPALLYVAGLGVVAVRRRAERDPARRRRRRATGRAMGRLRRASSAQEAGAAVRGFVADWFDVPEAGVTSAECVERLRGAGAASAEKAGELLEECDAAVFAGVGARVEVSEAAARGRELVRALGAELEGGR